MAKTCCTCQDEKKLSSPDACMCGCIYLNGWVAIIAVQLLALVGFIFSFAALGDCSFVELDDRLFFPSDMDEDLPLKVTQTQYVGFLTWKGLDGECYFYTNGSDPNGQIQEFFDIMGTDWEKARIVAMLSTCLSFVFFCYLLSFTCSSQTRGVRNFSAVFLSVVLTALQGITFVSFDSSFCDEYGCTFSRSAAFSVASMGCFFCAGLGFCCTLDYPGSAWKKPKLKSIAPEPAPVPEQVEAGLARASVETANKPDLGGSNMFSEELVMEDYDEEEVEDGPEEEEVVEEEEEEEGEGDDMIEEEIVEEEEVVEDGEETEVTETVTRTTEDEEVATEEEDVKAVEKWREQRESS